MDLSNTWTLEQDPEKKQVQFESVVEKHMKDYGYATGIESPIEFSSLLNLATGGVSGVASMNGRTLIMSHDGEIHEADKIVSSMESYRDTLTKISGESVAKAFGNAVTNGITGEKPMRSMDMLASVIGTMKSNGIMSEEFDPETDVDVQVGDLNLRPATTALQIAQMQFEKGENPIDVKSVAFASLADDKGFSSMSDPAKLYVLTRVAQGLDSLESTTQTKNIVEAARGLSNADSEFITGMQNKVSTEGQAVYLQLSPQERAAAVQAADAAKVNISKLAPELEASRSAVTKAESDFRIKWSPAAYHKFAHENMDKGGYQYADAMMKADQQTVSSLKAKVSSIESAVSFGQKEVDLNMTKATRGLVYDKKDLDTMMRLGIGGALTGLTGKEISPDMPLEEQARAIARYAVQKQFESVKDPVLQRYYGGVVTKLLDEIDKGNFEGLGLGDYTDKTSPLGRAIERGSSDERKKLVAARTEKYDKFRSKFQTDFYKKMVEGDDPAALLEENKPYLSPEDYSDYSALIKEQPAEFSQVINDPKASRSMKKAAMVELEKESASVAQTVAESLKFVRGGDRMTKAGLLKTTDDAMTAVVNSGLSGEHKAALLNLLARNNEISGISRGEFVDGYGFDRLFELHTAASKATGMYGNWTEFMDMYAALDKKLSGVSRNVTDTQKKEIVNAFIKEAADPLINRMRSASVSKLALGK